eukprot:2923412-Pyramimonas_sp.AAC.1
MATPADAGFAASPVRAAGPLASLAPKVDVQLMAVNCADSETNLVSWTRATCDLSPWSASHSRPSSALAHASPFS